MPDTYQMNSHQLLYPRLRPTARSLLGLPADSIIFCNFGRLGRVEPELISAWAGILHSVPAGIICLLERPAIAGILLREQFRRAGIYDD
eukprot:1554650-Rhodomonas_salina.1